MRVHCYSSRLRCCAAFCCEERALYFKYDLTFADAEISITPGEKRPLINLTF